MGEASRKKNMALGVLHSQKGFSLSELLVTLILVGLIMAAVAGGVSMVARSYTKVVDRADAEQLLSTTLNKMQDELCFARVDLETPTNTTGWSFISGISGLRIRFDNGKPSGTNEVGDDGVVGGAVEVGDNAVDKGAYMQFVVSASSGDNKIYFTETNNKRMYVTYDTCKPVYNGTEFKGRFEITGLKVISRNTKVSLAEIEDTVYVAAINYHE